MLVSFVIVHGFYNFCNSFYLSLIFFAKCMKFSRVMHAMHLSSQINKTFPFIKILMPPNLNSKFD